MKTINSIKKALYGFAIGFLNAIFGAGSGIVAVAVLKKQGLLQKSAQATALVIMLPLSVISTAVYLLNGYTNLGTALPFLPFGLLGSALGSILLGKIPDKMLRIAFNLFMIYTGIRLILK